MGKNGVCESGELCLYYLTNYTPPIFDLYVSDSNFAGEYFPGTTTRADSNTRSYWNRDDLYWRVYYGYNYTGSSYCIAPGGYGNLPRYLWDNVSSARYGTTTACPS